MGNGGGAFRAGRAGPLVLIAGATKDDEACELTSAPIGSLNGLWTAGEPLVRIGGLLAVLGLIGRGGRSELGTGGGGGRLATIKVVF